MSRSFALLTTIAAVIVMSACGAAPTATPTQAAKGASTASPSATATQASLSEFIALVQRGAQATYTASYGSREEPITFAQQPPKYYLASTSHGSTETLVGDGTAGYTCESETKTCSPTSRTVVNVYYSAAYWVAKMQQWPTFISGCFNCVTVTSFEQAYAGQTAQCITYQNPDEKDTLCALSGGVLAAAQSTMISTSFVMWDFSSTVSPSIFAVPAGYSVASS